MNNLWPVFWVGILGAAIICVSSALRNMRDDHPPSPTNTAAVLTWIWLLIWCGPALVMLWTNGVLDNIDSLRSRNSRQLMFAVGLCSIYCVFMIRHAAGVSHFLKSRVGNALFWIWCIFWMAPPLALMWIRAVFQ